MIQLYKKGNTHTVRGIKCEVCNFNLNELEHRLKEGWVKDPSELVIEKEEGPIKEHVELKKTDPDHPVRQEAKEKGIEGWDTKQLKTLEKELG